MSMFVDSPTDPVFKHAVNRLVPSFHERIEAFPGEGLRVPEHSGENAMPKCMEYPTDPGIPTLAAVCDPAELAKHLSLLSLPWPWDTSQAIRLRVLKWHRASRCTFEIALRVGSGWQELIGKVYAEDRSDIYQAMEEIRRAGFGSDAEFALPRPLAYLAPLRLLLYEKAPGTRARELILNPRDSEDILAAERCAHWLARFQALAPRLGPVYTLDGHLSSLKQWCQSLSDHGGPFAKKASLLFEHLKEAAAGLGRIELCPGHGTYTPGQVLLDGGRTITIDWDTYEMADPCRDVARFVVEIKRNALKHFGSLHACARAAGIFVKTYFAAAHAAITPNLAFHEAAICLERAKHDRDKQVQGWQQKAEIMLDEGVRILSGESIESATATDTTQVVLVPRFGNGVAAAVNKTAFILGLVAEALLDLSGA